jgi:hypothetical protein
MIIIIVIFSLQTYYTIIVQGRGCFEADKIIFLTSNSIWFAFSHIAFSLNSSNKVWIQNDHTEVGIANELVDRGIPKKDIVLGYQAPYLRHLTDFAVN